MGRWPTRCGGPEAEHLGTEKATKVDRFQIRATECKTGNIPQPAASHRIKLGSAHITVQESLLYFLQMSFIDVLENHPLITLGRHSDDPVSHYTRDPNAALVIER